MKIQLDCPQAQHGDMMRVYCKKTGELCLFQYFKNCKGWWVNSPSAARCQIRKEKDDGENG